MKKVVIFLDIDGVIATRKALESVWQEYTGCKEFVDAKEFLEKTGMKWPSVSMYDWPFDRNCIKNFHTLQRKLYEMDLEPCVVISSSWRMGFDCSGKREKNSIEDIFILKGLHISNIVGRTKRFGERGKEILAFIEDNKLDVPFVSIDDENKYDVVEHLGEERCVDTTFKKGFTEKHVTETIEKLKAQL